MELFIIVYLVNFIRTLIIIAIIYFAIRIFSRYILPMIVDKGVKNIQQKMYEQQKQNQRSSRREGEVIIEKNKDDNTKFNQGEGEYVDFEEVE